MPIEVELRQIGKMFGSFQAADDVNLQVEKGQLVGLLGPSGSGKTTILRMIAGLETPDTGDILIGGRRVNDLPPGRRGIGFVFQNYALFRHMTVRENIAFGLKVQHLPAAKSRERVDTLIELIGPKECGSRYPLQLSGGQRQRVAFARALAAPKVSQTFATQVLVAAPAPSPAYLSHLIRSEVDKWAKVVKKSGVEHD